MILHLHALYNGVRGAGGGVREGMSLMRHEFLWELDLETALGKGSLRF